MGEGGQRYIHMKKNRRLGETTGEGGLKKEVYQTKEETSNVVGENYIKKVTTKMEQLEGREYLSHKNGSKM